MPINRNNYEVYFIDYIDGNLSSSQAKELLAFLEQNPDLAAELNGIDNAHLQPIESPYSNGEFLKKDLQWGVANRLDYLCIAKIEGDICNEEESELQELLVASSVAKSDFASFEKSRLLADSKIAFSNKSAIKHINILGLTYKTIWALGSSVAAVFIVLFGLAIGLNRFSKMPDQPLALSSKNIDGIEKAIEPIEIENSIKKPQVEMPTADIVEKHSQPIPVKASSAKTTDQDQPEPSRFVADNKIEVISRIELASIPQSVTIEDSKALLAMAGISVNSVANSQKSNIQKQSGVREIGLFELAQMGFDRLSEVTGKTLSLNAHKDSDGDIRKINFESELFAVSVPVRKK
jgi:hypothetical protein